MVVTGETGADLSMLLSPNRVCRMVYNMPVLKQVQTHLLKLWVSCSISWICAIREARDEERVLFLDWTSWKDHHGPQCD